MFSDRGFRPVVKALASATVLALPAHAQTTAPLIDDEMRAFLQEEDTLRAVQSALCLDVDGQFGAGSYQAIERFVSRFRPADKFGVLSRLVEAGARPDLVAEVCSRAEVPRDIVRPVQAALCQQVDGSWGRASEAALDRTHLMNPQLGRGALLRLLGENAETFAAETCAPGPETDGPFAELPLDAITSIEGAVHIGGGDYLMWSGPDWLIYPTIRSGEIELGEWPFAVDAATLLGGGNVVLFAGESFYSYDLETGVFSDQTSPLTSLVPMTVEDAAQSLAPEPLEAALRSGERGFVAFRSDSWVESGARAQVLADWPGGWPLGRDERLGAAAASPDGDAAFFFTSDGVWRHERATGRWTRMVSRADLLDVAYILRERSGAGRRESTSEAMAERPPETLPENLPETAALLLDPAGLTALVADDPANALDFGDSVTMRITFDPQWNEDFCQSGVGALGLFSDDLIYLFSNRDETYERLSIALSCDKAFLFVSSAGESDLVRINDHLSEGRNTLHLVLRGAQMEARLNGASLGMLAVNAGTYPPLPVALGADVSGTGRFAGEIASFHLWSQPLQADLVKEMGAARTSLNSRLLGLSAYLEKDRDGRPVLTLLPLLPSPTGTIWVASGDELAPQASAGRMSPDGGPRRRSRPIDRYIWSETGILCRYRAFTFRVDHAVPYVRTGPTTFASLGSDFIDICTGYGGGRDAVADVSLDQIMAAGGRSTLRLLPGGTLLVGSERYVVPATPEAGEAYNSNWGGSGGPVNINLLARGFHIKSMDIDTLRSSGANGAIFATDSATVGALAPYRWRSEAGKNLPWGLWLDQSGIQCDGSTSSREVNTSSQLSLSKSQTVSTTVANVSANAAVQSEIRSLSNTGLARTITQSICERYVVYVDMMRVRLAASFREAVRELSTDLRQMECNLRTVQGEGRPCERRLRAFVDNFGTSYANSVTFGGRVYAITDMDSSLSNTVKSAREQFGFGFDQTITAGFTLGPPGAQVNSSTQLRYAFDYQNVTQSMVSQMQQEINSRTRWRSLGGIGTSQFGNWTLDDNSVVPVHVDLRPLNELLSPRFFDDPEIFETTSRLLGVHLQYGYEAPNRDVVFAPSLLSEAEIRAALKARQTQAEQAEEAAALARKRPCGAYQETHGNDHVFALFNLPKTEIGAGHPITDGSAHAYRFPRCYRVAWSDVIFTCKGGGDKGGVWERVGSITRDANCYPDYGLDHKLLTVTFD